MVPLKVLLTISWLANVIYAEGFGMFQQNALHFIFRLIEKFFH